MEPGSQKGDQLILNEREMVDQKSISLKERNRLRAAIKRANMTSDEKEQQKEIQRLRALRRRQSETPEEQSKRRERERERANMRRHTEDPQKRQQRLKAGRERAAKKRQMESPLDRECRLKISRERLALKRQWKREGYVIPDLRKGPRSLCKEEFEDSNTCHTKHATSTLVSIITPVSNSCLSSTECCDER